MPRWKAVIFDLDGTLIDSAADIRSVLNAVLAGEGRRPLALPEVAAMIGDGPGKLIERALAATGGPMPDEARQALTARFVVDYDASPVVHTRPYPGVAETLAALAGDGVRLGICTNKPEGATGGVLRALDLARFFAVVIGSGTIAGVQKPDRRALQAALEALEVAVTEAVMVGDAVNDVAVARNAGTRVLIRAGGYTAVPAEALGADGVFVAFSDLPALLAQLP